MNVCMYGQTDETINSFKQHLDKFWFDQDVL